MIDYSSKLGHELRDQIHADIRLWQLEAIQVLHTKSGVQCKNLLHDAGQLGVLEHCLVVSLNSSDCNDLPRQTLPGRIRCIRLGDLHLEAASLTVESRGLP